MVKEALIDEPWPWLSGVELTWRTGHFRYIEFGSQPSMFQFSCSGQHGKGTCVSLSLSVCNATVCILGASVLLTGQSGSGSSNRRTRGHVLVVEP